MTLSRLGIMPRAHGAVFEASGWQVGLIPLDLDAQG